MKKILFLFLGLIILLTMIGCDNEKPVDPEKPIDPTPIINEENIQKVIDSISKLSTSITLSDEDEIKNCVTQYESLNTNEKEKVLNYSILENAIKRIEFLKNEQLAIEEAYRETIKYLNTVIPSEIENEVASIKLPSFYEHEIGEEVYVIWIDWNSSDPYTINLAGKVSHNIKDLSVDLGAILSCSNIKETSSFQKEVLVKKTLLKNLDKGKVVIGYFYGAYTKLTDLDYETLDMVNYCFAQIKETKKDGESTFSIDISDLTSISIISEIRNKGVRVLLSLGGWQDGESAWIPYQNAAKTADNRLQTAKAILEVLKKYHLDGIDMDWEYPRTADRSNYTLLIKQIRDTLKAESEDYIISAAIPGSSWANTRFELAKLNEYFDYINLMTYDMDYGSNVTCHHTSLYDSTYATGSVDTSVKYFLNNGVDREKIVIGLAFYGRVFTNVLNVNNGLGQPYSTMKSITFTKILNNYISRIGNGVTKHFDNLSGVYYLYDSINQELICYDGPESIKSKCQYAIDADLGGVMFWSYNDDSTQTLMKAINEKIDALKR